MENHVYSDDFGAIGVSGPIVRIDLMVQSMTEQNAASKPTLVVQHRLIMPLDGFLRAAGKIQAVVQEMEKKGIITRTKPRAASDKKGKEAGV